MKVVALAGGVGGAKLVQGLASLLDASELTVIVNTADDFDHFGLRICPDIDTVCYTLAGLANPQTGWGRTDETWNAFEGIKSLGGPDWFGMGDRDLATHLERTRRLKAGDPLSVIVASFCETWGVRHTVLPMTNDRVATLLETDEGRLEFQEYFVHRQCKPRIRSIAFRGITDSLPSSGVLDALDKADTVILCPSNPLVSIDPILAVPGIAQAIRPSRTVAVSPIVGGRAIKGPAVKMLTELGQEPSAAGAASHYAHTISAFVLDRIDSQLAPEIESYGMRVLVCNTLMPRLQERKRLAHDILGFILAGQR